MWEALYKRLFRRYVEAGAIISQPTGLELAEVPTCMLHVQNLLLKHVNACCRGTKDATIARLLPEEQ